MNKHLQQYAGGEQIDNLFNECIIVVVVVVVVVGSAATQVASYIYDFIRTEISEKNAFHKWQQYTACSVRRLHTQSHDCNSVRLQPTAT